ncbi:glucosaminidase domain-containing protein [Francisella philomiragia]
MIPVNLNKYIFFVLTIFFMNICFASSDKYHLETAPVPAGTYKPDFKDIKDVTEKKKIFIEFMSKEIDEANQELCRQRQTILKLQEILNKKQDLNEDQKVKIKKYSSFYKVSNAKSLQEQVDALVTKVNIAPKSLVIAQAILETGWGTSRFAVDYNNYFGLHCFEENCGVKAQDADVQVETFKDVGDSILGYYFRLNTGDKFTKFRQVREIGGVGSDNTIPLINTLTDYSSLRGDEYQNRLNSVIKSNNLDKLKTSC